MSEPDPRAEIARMTRELREGARRVIERHAVTETQTVDLAAVQLVAERMFQRYASEYSADHLSWRDFEADARSDLEAVAPLLIADALDKAAEDVTIPRASSLAAAWLQGRASRYRAGAS